MKYYIKNKETGDKFIVLNRTQDKEGNPHYIITSVKTKVILRITEDYLFSGYAFDGLVD